MTGLRQYILLFLVVAASLVSAAAGKFQISVATQSGGDDIEVGEQFYVYLKLDNID